MLYFLLWVCGSYYSILLPTESDFWDEGNGSPGTQGGNWKTNEILLPKPFPNLFLWILTFLLIWISVPLGKGPIAEKNKVENCTVSSSPLGDWPCILTYWQSFTQKMFRPSLNWCFPNLICEMSVSISQNTV